MNTKSKGKLGFGAVIAVALLVCVAVSPVLSDEADAANPATTVNIQPGQSWSWTPSFTAGLSPTVTVSANASAMPADNAAFGASSGNATVSNGKITVSIPSDFSGSKYFVKVKAQTSNPTQVQYYEITFNVATYGLSYNYSTVTAKVGTAISEISPTVSGGVTAKSFAISGSLPAGLSFNTTTGKITGTPTAYKAQTQYTITATLNTVPVQTVTAKVSIGAFSNLTSSNYTVYAIKNTTTIAVPAIAAPSGTVVDTLTLTATKDGTSATVTAGTAYNGLTVTAKTGAISGKPTVSGTYVFTEKFKATSATGGSETVRTVTVLVEDKVALGGSTGGNSFVGHSDTFAVTKSGPGVTWKIDSIKVGSSTYTNPSSNGFAISNGTVTCGTAVPAGTYTVVVKATSSTTTNATTTSGATGTSASANYATRTLTVTVAPVMAANNAVFYMAEGGAFDPVTLSSNIAGTVWTVTDYGGLDATKISVANGGQITAGNVGSGTSSSSPYTMTVKAQDPNNSANSATATVTVHVAAQLAYTNSPTAGALNA